METDFTPIYPKKLNRFNLIAVAVSTFFSAVLIWAVIANIHSYEQLAAFIFLIILAAIAVGLWITYVVICIRGYLYDKSIKEFIKNGKIKKATVKDVYDSDKKGINRVTLYKINLCIKDTNGNEIIYTPNYLYSAKMVEYIKAQPSIRVYILNGKCLPFPAYIRQYTIDEMPWTDDETHIHRRSRMNIHRKNSGVDVVTAPSEAYEGEPTPLGKMMDVTKKTLRVAHIVKGVIISLILCFILFLLIRSFFV